MFLLLTATPLFASQGDLPGTSVEPFKLGTFNIGGVQHVGIVLRDSLIVEMNSANAALEGDATYPAIPMPVDMLELIGRYEYGLKVRLYEIVNELVANDRLIGSLRPTYVHDVADVRTLAPILYPGKILNAAVNFYSHVNETGTPEERATARRARRENRGVPYLFLKPTRGVVIGNGTPVVIPHGRDRTDWEVELAAVIGRASKYVSADDAQDHIFGYMVSLDISDRGGRPPGGNPLRSDWFVGKGHDTFAPMGPWIVPKEFYGDPMENLRQTLRVGDEQMQEATAGDMIHSLYELVEYASSIVTLYPGDVINNGTSGGVGMGTAVRGEQRFLQPGDEIIATIDGIGTLTMPVVSEEPPPTGSGARLPPVSSYRR
jgi:2-keto-4-pentenoate hydratase/2-oxohepta-3-ene-1,7-dioic acid hydratase in catechol pathway|tara:strand:- start:191 stop:1315 length:1125 start_codon:yes stop_codon:yes gene_type:complete